MPGSSRACSWRSSNASAVSRAAWPRASRGSALRRFATHRAHARPHPLAHRASPRSRCRRVRAGRVRRRARSAHRARRMPAAEARAGGAVRRARGARGSRASRTAARSRSSSPCCRRTRCRRSPIRSCILAGGPGQAASHARRRSRAADRDAPHARHRAGRPARHRPLVAARLRGVRARRARTNSRSIRCRRAAVRVASCRHAASTPRNTRRRRGSPTSRRCATRSAIRARTCGAAATARASRRNTCAAIRSACAAWCSTASRRPSMSITLDVWRTRERALDDVIAACRASAPCCDGASGSGRDARSRSRQALGRTARASTLADPRTGSTRELHVDVRRGDRRAAAAHLRAGGGEPDARDAGARAGAATSRRSSPPSLVTIGDLAEQMNAALHYSVTCAEDVPRITRAERTNGARRRARARARATGRSPCATCGRTARCPPISRSPSRATCRCCCCPAASIRSRRPPTAARSRRRCPTASTSSRAASATSCRRTRARRG